MQFCPFCFAREKIINSALNSWQTSDKIPTETISPDLLKTKMHYRLPHQRSWYQVDTHALLLKSLDTLLTKYIYLLSHSNIFRHNLLTHTWSQNILASDLKTNIFVLSSHILPWYSTCSRHTHLISWPLFFWSSVHYLWSPDILLTRRQTSSSLLAHHFADNQTYSSTSPDI